MKMMRKILMFMMCMMGVLIISDSVTEASDGWGSWGDNITWTFTESTGVLEIKGSGDMPEGGRNKAPWISYHNNIKKVVIGEGITSVSEYLFDSISCGWPTYYLQLQTVNLPSTIKRIEKRAFAGCKIMQIDFPKNLAEIGDAAFEETLLTTIQIPGTVSEIGEYAFAQCKYLKNIDLKDGIKKISFGCFAGSSIIELQIPSSVTVIGSYAFSECNNLLYIYIPPNIETLGKSVFSGCKQLRYATVDAAVDLDCFYCCEKLEIVKLGDGVKSINGGCFGGCSALKAVYVPVSVNKISNRLENLTLYGYPKTTAWDYAGKTQGVNFVDVSTAQGQKEWDSLWEACVNAAKRLTGDMDNNDKVDLTDAQIVLKAALKITTLSDEDFKIADVNSSGKLDLTDAQLVLKFALKIISSFN